MQGGDHFFPKRGVPGTGEKRETIWKGKACPLVEAARGCHEQEKILQKSTPPRKKKKKKVSGSEKGMPRSSTLKECSGDRKSPLRSFEKPASRGYLIKGGRIASTTPKFGEKKRHFACEKKEAFRHEQGRREGEGDFLRGRPLTKRKSALTSNREREKPLSYDKGKRVVTPH